MENTQSPQTIEVDAETLDGAEQIIQGFLPPGFQVNSKKVISDGTPITIHGFGATMEIATSEALKRVPADAEILEKKEMTQPERKIITITASNEKDAINSAIFRGKQHLGGDVEVEEIKLKLVGRKGILGIGVKPNEYQAVLVLKADYSITYKERVRITVQIIDDHTAFQMAFVKTLKEYRSSSFPAMNSNGQLSVNSPNIELVVYGDLGDKREKCQIILRSTDSFGKKEFKREVEEKDIQHLLQELEFLVGHKIIWSWVPTDAWLNADMHPLTCYTAKL